MLKWLMNRAIAAFERQWNYDAGYVHEIIDASPKLSPLERAAFILHDAINAIYVVRNPDKLRHLTA